GLAGLIARLLEIFGMDEYAETVTHYVTASQDEDLDLLADLRHPDWQMVRPQAGEQGMSHDDYVAMRLNRPEGAPRVEALGTGGSGDTWWAESIIHYADGSRWL